MLNHFTSGNTNEITTTCIVKICDLKQWCSQYRVIVERLMGLKVVHPELQRDLGRTDPCERAGCSHFCLISRKQSASCTCNFGFQLQADRKTCQEQGKWFPDWQWC